MRRVLVLGGTGWLGCEIARRALEEGAEVVCLARGESGSAPDGARHIRADRTSPDAYHEVEGDWDEVIELAYEPGLVRSALEAFAPRAAHWTLISSVSVYNANDEPHADETAPLVEPQDLAEYPDAKVAAERSSTAALGDRLLISRPGLIVGAGDPTDRFGYWPARLSRNGPTLVPETDGRFVQFIDIEDLARWTIRAGREKSTGIVNAVGEVHQMQSVFDATAAVTGYTGELVTVSDEQLLAQGVNYWAGPRSLPLWLPKEATAFAQRSGVAYLTSGGTLSSLRETLARVQEDEVSRGVSRERRSGLSAIDEATVLQSVL